MKKFVLFLLCLFICILLVGCKKNDIINENSLKIMDASIISDEKGMKITVKVDHELLGIEMNDISCYGIIIIKQQVASLSDITLDTKDVIIETLMIEDDLVTFIIPNIDKSEYNTPYTIRAYIKYQEQNGLEKVVYGTTYKEFKLYTLAKSMNTDYAKEIVAQVDNKIVSTVEITIDTKNYTVSTLSNEYQVELDTDYNYITITITLASKYWFNNNIILIANSKEISSNDYTITTESIIYKFNDPNWTKPY